jgi:glutamine amidotransferase
MLNVAIIDYGSGNLRSAAKAFERVAPAASRITVTNDPAKLAEATHIVLPGVGAFADCMRGLEATKGMCAALEEQVLKNRKPFLGVCVGMQMLFGLGHEHGTHKGLGWIEGEVVRIGSRDQVSGVSSALASPTPDPRALKIPHMGWNDLQLRTPAHPLLQSIPSGAHAYFVHSYHAVCDAGFVLATTDYGSALTAIVAKDNIMGTQFHPEKSQSAGLQLIGNFLSFGN